MRLDAATGLLTAGAGCRLRDVNRFLLAKGRFLPAGSCATVGLAGLTLGGGYGMFARKWGLTCDHLRSLRMVDGTGAVRDSAAEPDLLWAARGGGNGHFGIVTQLTLQTRVVPRAFSSWKFRAYRLTQARATQAPRGMVRCHRSAPERRLLRMDHERHPAHGPAHHHGSVGAAKAWPHFAAS